MIQSQVLQNLNLHQGVKQNSVTLILSAFLPDVIGRAFLLAQWIDKEKVTVTAYAISGKHFIKQYEKTMPHADLMTAMINVRAGYGVTGWLITHWDEQDKAINHAISEIKGDYSQHKLSLDLLYNAPILSWYDGLLIEIKPPCKSCPKSILCSGVCNNKQHTNPEYSEFTLSEGEGIYLTLKSTPVDDKEMICISKTSVDGLIIARLYIKIGDTKQKYHDFSGTPGEFSDYLKQFSTKFLEPKGAKWVPDD